jgi:hypothetical protein
MYSSIYGSTALEELRRFFSFLIHTQSAGLLGREISLSQGRYLHTEQHKQNKRTQTSMPWVGFEPMMPVVERTKMVDRAATVISRRCVYYLLIQVRVASHSSRLQTAVTEKAGVAAGSDRTLSWSRYHLPWLTFVVLLSPSRQTLGNYLKLGHDYTLQQPFQFILH